MVTTILKGTELPTTTQVPVFNKGAEAAEKANKSLDFGDRTHYLRIEKPGDVALIRFLTDVNDLITVKQHSFVPTKGKPSGFTGDKWPQSMNAICRYDPQFQGMFPDCYICDQMVGKVKNPRGQDLGRPSSRTWALACLRQEVTDPKTGEVIGWEDVIRDIVRKDKNGNETHNPEKAIVVVNYGWKNFFAALAGHGKVYKTLLDRDYHIARSGEETETMYTPSPLDPLAVDEAGKIKFDLRKPEHLAEYGFTSAAEVEAELIKAIMLQASDEHYARFFDPRYTIGKDGAVVEASAEEQAQAPNNDSENSVAEEMAKRVRRFKVPVAEEG